jgi:hypothetical protein
MRVAMKTIWDVKEKDIENKEGDLGMLSDIIEWH